MKLITKRNGIVLAIAGAIAALLIEPVNGPKRRARIQRVLAPAGGTLGAVRRRLTGRDGETDAPEGSLAERLQHVAVRAQGQIDVPLDPPAERQAHIGNGAAHQDGAAHTTETPKRRGLRKKSEPTG